MIELARLRKKQEEERAAAEKEWKQHLQGCGDGTAKHAQPLFRPGMRVWMRVPKEVTEAEPQAVEEEREPTVKRLRTSIWRR